MHARFYKIKNNQEKGEEGIEAEYLCNTKRSPSRTLEASDQIRLGGVVETYHCFEVFKKGNVKKTIVFHALGDIKKHTTNKQVTTRAPVSRHNLLYSNLKSSPCLWERRKVHEGTWEDSPF